MHGNKARYMNREQLDCLRRDIHSRHPIFSGQAIQTLRECLELGDFDCEATRINAFLLYGSLTPR